MHSIVGGEEDRTIDVGQDCSGAAASGPNIGGQDGAGSRAVASPNLLSIDAIVGRKKERTADIGQVARKRTVGAGADILEQDSPNVGAVALPDLVAIGGIVGPEE